MRVNRGLIDGPTREGIIIALFAYLPDCTGWLVTTGPPPPHLLAITKHFCEMLEGSIEVETEIGKGTTFTVLIPRRAGKTVNGKTVSASADAAAARIVPGNQPAPNSPAMV